jgi:hypothetical protein
VQYLNFANKKTYIYHCPKQELVSIVDKNKDKRINLLKVIPLAFLSLFAIAIIIIAVYSLAERVVTVVLLIAAVYFLSSFEKAIRDKNSFLYK